MFAEIMNLLQKGVTALGSFLIVWGMIDIGTNLGENGNGAALTGGFKKFIGGAIVAAAAVYIGSITM